MKDFAPLHKINKEIVELSVPTREMALKIESEVNEILNNGLNSVTEVLMDEVCNADENLILNRIIIDLGEILERDFKYEFNSRFRNELKKTLRTEYANQKERQTQRQITFAKDILISDKYSSGIDDNTAFIVQDSDHLFSILVYFLEKGSLPWWATVSGIKELEEKILNNITSFNVQELFNQISSNNIMPVRLVEQFDEQFIILMLSELPAISQINLQEVLRELSELISGLFEPIILRHELRKELIKRFIVERGSLDEEKYISGILERITSKLHSLSGISADEMGFAIFLNMLAKKIEGVTLSRIHKPVLNYLEKIHFRKAVLKRSSFIKYTMYNLFLINELVQLNKLGELAAEDSLCDILSLKYTGVREIFNSITKELKIRNELALQKKKKMNVDYNLLEVKSNDLEIHDPSQYKADFSDEKLNDKIETKKIKPLPKTESAEDRIKTKLTLDTISEKPVEKSSEPEKTVEDRILNIESNEVVEPEAIKMFDTSTVKDNEITDESTKSLIEELIHELMIRIGTQLKKDNISGELVKKEIRLLMMKIRKIIPDEKKLKQELPAIQELLSKKLTGSGFKDIPKLAELSEWDRSIFNIAEPSILNIEGDNLMADNYQGNLTGLHEDKSAEYYIDNAGLVLTSPFLTLLFQRLEYLDENKIIKKDKSVRAIYLLQRIVNDDYSIDENKLVLNKVICGLPINYPIERNIELTTSELDQTNSLLMSMIENWTKIRNTSVEGFRESFLRRQGKLTRLEKQWHLLVDRKSYDVLLDSIPWSFSIIKYPWMNEAIKVEW